MFGLDISAYNAIGARALARRDAFLKEADELRERNYDAIEGECEVVADTKMIELPDQRDMTIL